ncbi:MAG: DUF3369 domain-containing protein [Idiomarina sp.]|nr:DUF3369 domain-containing protein [Idiomarina sp.]
MTDHYLFADEPVIAQEGLNERWKILIVDDEPEVHAVTRLALSDFKFLGRGLEFYSAESGEEGCKLMREHPDAAIILLDVVMETDDAGLKVARYIREDLDNHFTRIILRTGQPGQAPERTVIINYDINDYKSKTELTAQKLFTAVMSSLRSYRDIMSIEHSRRGLEKILHSSADLFSEQSMDTFLDGIVQQLSWLIGGVRQVLYAEIDPERNAEEFTVRAAFGDEADNLFGRPVKAALPIEALRELKSVVATGKGFYSDTTALIFCPSHTRATGGLLCLTGIARPLSDAERDLLRLFSEQVQVALSNVLREHDCQQFVGELVERVLNLEHHQLLEEGKAQHPAGRAALILADALAVDGKEQGQLALAATLMAIIGHVAEPTLATDSNAGRIYYQRLMRLTHGLKNRDNYAGVIPLLQAACATRYERYDGAGIPGEVAAEQLPITQQILALLAIVYAELAVGKQPAATLKQLSAEPEGRFSPQLMDALRNHLATVLATLENA